MNDHRDNSDRLTIEFHGIEAGSCKNINSEIVTHFSLEVASTKNSCLDEVFQDFKKDNEVIGLEWDNWSGYIVNAKTKTAEPLAREIAGYISALDALMHAAALGFSGQGEL